MTSWQEWIFYADCVVLVVVPLWFILNSVYQDGILGRIALATISFAAATFLMERMDGEGHEMLTQTLLLVTAFTAFLCWHLFRFETRIARQTRAQHGDGRRPEAQR